LFITDHARQNQRFLKLGFNGLQHQLAAAINAKNEQQTLTGT
jgi:hypothetical protein